jgi:hypothetical protein
MRVFNSTPFDALAGVGQTIAIVPLKIWRQDGRKIMHEDYDWQYMKIKRDSLLRKCKKLGIIADYETTYTSLRVYRVR